MKFDEKLKKNNIASIVHNVENEYDGTWMNKFILHIAKLVKSPIASEEGSCFKIHLRPIRSNGLGKLSQSSVELSF